ncbi:hypothetical protein [Microseira sp. BLCC-F43]|uniref:hypothetical protein n=1 Tax=Microseira sp. BLCC-F43 TaxID=3153602 RepID=UPI0035BA1D4A
MTQRNPVSNIVAPKFYAIYTGLKLPVTIGGWCVTLQVPLLRSNMLAASRTLQKKYASCVSPNTFKFPPAPLLTCTPAHLPTCTPAHLPLCQDFLLM